MHTKSVVRLGLALTCWLAGLELRAAEVSGTLAANTTWADTSGDYVIDNFGGPLVVPAGVTLTVSPGVTVRVKYSNKSALEVRGTVAAQGATVHLRTSNSAAGGKTAVRVLENGGLEWADCQVTGVHEGTSAEEARLIELAGAARGTFRGTRFETGVTGVAVGNAMVASGTAAVECVAAAGGGGGRFTGFRKPIQVTSTTATTVSQVTFEGFGTALELTAGSATVTDCSLVGGADTRGVLFTPEARDLRLERCTFTGGARGVVFDGEGSDLTIEGCTFTGCSEAVEAVMVNALTFNHSTIAGAVETKGKVGLHTEGMTSFAATGSAIRRQQTGIYVQHVNRNIDVSGIQFAENDYDVYASGSYTFPATITQDTVVRSGRYIVNTDAVVIAEGATLTLEPGTVVVYEAAYRGLFQVEGRLVAEETRFEFPGLPRYGDSPGSRFGGIVAAGNGVVELNRCHLLASPVGAYPSPMLLGLGQSKVVVTSCLMEVQPGGIAQSALLLLENCEGVLTGTAEAPTTIRGFPMAVDMQSSVDFRAQHTLWESNTVALRCLTDANLILAACAFRSNQTALKLERLGSWSVQGVTVERNGRGLDFGTNWTYAGFDSDGFQLADNNEARFLRTGGATLQWDLALHPAGYTVACVGDPLGIALGARLTLATGTTVRTTETDGISTDYELFKVEGAMVAEGVVFELKTISIGNDHTRAIEVVGSGQARLQDCTLRAHNRFRHLGGNAQMDQVFAVRDQGSLVLVGCTLQAEEVDFAGEATSRPGRGILVEGEGTLSLQASGGSPTVIDGFAMAAVSVQGQARADLGSAILSGSAAGLVYGGSQPTVLGAVTIQGCTRGIVNGGSQLAVAGTVTIRGCERGIDYGTNWAGTGLDTSRVVFENNSYDRLVKTQGATIDGDVTMAPVTFSVDCDDELNTGSPMRIAAGGKLTLGAGTTLRTVDTSDGGYQTWNLSTYQLMRVEGLLIAADATFEIRTLGLASDRPASIQVLGSGEVRMQACMIRAGDRSRHLGHPDSYVYGRPDSYEFGGVFDVAGQGSLVLAGCTLITTASEVTEDETWRTHYGVLVKEEGKVTLEAHGGRATVIEGFRKAGLDVSGAAALTLRGAEIRGCGIGLRYMATGALSVAETRIVRCGEALDLDGAWVGIDSSGFELIENTVERRLRGGFTLANSMTLPRGSYGFNMDTGPVTIPPGVRLTLAEGCSIRASDSVPNNNDHLFVVEGELVARSCEVHVQQLSQGTASVWKALVFRGTGRGELTACRLLAVGSHLQPGSALVVVEDAASLRVEDGEWFGGDQNGVQVESGIVHRSSGTLEVTGCSFMGFKTGLQVATVPADYMIRENRFLGNSVYAVLNLASEDLDCSDNWWGHPSGPRHPTNPLAQGDPVSDRVLFHPYEGQAELPTVLLVEHGAGQAPNGLAGGPAAADAVVFRFGVQAASGAWASGLTVQLLDREGLQETNLVRLRLVADADGDGVFDPGSDPVLASGQTDWAESSVAFAGDWSAAGSFLVVGDWVGVPSGAAVKMRVTFLDLAVPLGTFVGGALADAVHYRDRVMLADHGVWSYGDRLSALETQNGVVWSAFSLGSGSTLREVRFDLTDVVGLEARQFTEVELVIDTDGDGLAGDVEPRVRGAVVAMAGATGTITFRPSGRPAVSGGQYLLRGNLNGLRVGDALTVSLARAGLAPEDPRTALSGSVRSVRHVVDAPLFVLDAAFQIRNQFIEVDQLPRAPLLGFTFMQQGRTIQGLVFRLSEVTGIRPWEVTNVRLYRDDNRNGVLEPRETVTVGGPGVVEIDAASYEGTVRFSVPFTAQGTFVMAADIAHLDPGDSLTVELTSVDVDAGVGAIVDGGVSPARHVVERPGLAPSPLQQNWTLTWRSPGGVKVCGGYSRDGRKAIVGYSSGAAYVYDLATGVPERMLMRHYDALRYAGFSGDDSQIITVTRDGAVYVWNAATGELERQLFADVLVLNAVPSPDFTRLLVMTEGRRALLLSLLDERQLWEFTVNSAVHSVDFSPDGQRVLLGCEDKRAYVLDAQTGAIPKVVKGGITYDLIFQGHHDTVHGVAFTANGARIMTASRDATATLWYADDPVNPIYTVSLNGQRCDAAFVNRTGDRVALITNQRFLRMFDEEGLELYAYTLPGELYTGIHGFALFRDDGTEFMIGSDSGGSGSVVSRFRSVDHGFLDTVGPTGMVSGNSYSPVRMSGDGHRVFFMKHDGLEVMQRRTGVPIRRYPELNAQYPYDVSPDGTKLAWLDGSLRLAVVDDDRLSVVATHGGVGGSPVTMSRSGGLVAIGDRIYRTASGEVFANSPNDDADYPNAFSPDNELWGIAIGDSIKTMRTTDETGSLEYGVTLTTQFGTAKRVLYHPDGVRVGGVFNNGVQFYRLDNNDPVGIYDNRGGGLHDAVLSNDGSMLLVARGNSVRLYDMRTGRPLRYFYPLHSNQQVAVTSVAFGARDDLVLIAWSDNYVETYERTRLLGLAITPGARVLPPTASQEFRVEAQYDDGSVQDVSPKAYRTQEKHPNTAQLWADPPEAVEIVGSRVTVMPQAVGTITLTAAYTEGGAVRSATATITVGASPLVLLTPEVAEITLSPGVVFPVMFTARYADGYEETVIAELTVDAPVHANIVGNNLTVLRTAGTRTLTVTGSYTSRGVTRTGTMKVLTHGPQSNWTRAQVTSGGDIFTMDYRPDGRQLAVGGSSGAISLYAVGASPTAYELEAVILAHERPIRHVFYRGNGELVSVSEDGWIRTWALADTSRPVREYAHDAAITCAAHEGGWLVFGDNLGRVQTLVLEQNRVVWSRAVHTRSVRGVALDGDAVFSGGDDRLAVLSRRADGMAIANYPGYSAPVVAVGIRNGMTYTISEDRRVVEWTKGTVDDNIWEYFLPGVPSAIRQTAERLYVTVGAPKTERSEGAVVVKGVSSTTWVYDNDGLLLNQMEHPPYLGGVTALAVSPGGDYLLTGRATTVATITGPDGKGKSVIFPFHSVQFWSATRGSYRGSLDHNGSIESARITRDGEWLFTQSAERVFRWHLSEGLERSKFLETGYDIPYRFDGLRMSDDATGTVATRVGDTMYLMDAVQRLLRMSVHHQGLGLFDLARDGRRLVSFGDNLRLWDVSLDFPTVLYETSDKQAGNLAFFPSCLPEREGDWVAGLSSESSGEPFAAVLNNRGLQFSGITLPVDSSSGASEAKWKSNLAVSRDQSRIAMVANPVFPGEGALDLALIYVLELCNPSEGISPRLVRMLEIDAEGGQAAVALSDDGSLLFYGSGRTAGSLLDINTGRLIYTFAPPSAGTLADRGPADAQFTRNDGALMIAWGEGYASVYVRQGFERLEIAPAQKSVSPGEQLPLQATAVFADGTRMEVTSEVRWSLAATPHAGIEGTSVKLNPTAPSGATIAVEAEHTILGVRHQATSTLTVSAPQFEALVVDPARLSVDAGTEVRLRYFAKMADGSTREVTEQTTLSAEPAGRVTIQGQAVQIPSLTQAGYIEVTGRCVLAGDERWVTSALRVRDPAEVVDPGDFDGDGMVAFADVLHLVGLYGVDSSSPRWDQRCDFNRNGTIDFADVLGLVALYGKVYGTKDLPVAPVDLAGGPMAHLRVEGPTRPVAVGQTFEVRIYAKETTAAAKGVTGVLLDLLFDSESVAPVASFKPRTAVASPYNSILAEGRLESGRVAALGGVHLAGGLGDGQEVLFATVSFTATRAGDASFRLAAGDGGVTLTQPVGLLGTDRIDYGLASLVRVVDEGFLGRLEVATGTLRQTLRFGTRPGAVAGFESRDGDVPGLPPDGLGGGAWLMLEGRRLATDVRPVTPGQVWHVRVVVAPGSRDQAVTLSWAATEALPGTALMLIPADAEGNPIPGLRHSLRVPGGVSIRRPASGTGSADFLVVWDRAVTQTWRLEPGWNWVGCSIEPDERSLAAVLGQAGLRAVLQWTPSVGYSIPEALDSRQGYLVYAREQMEIALSGVSAREGVHRLEPGWNLVSEFVRAALGSGTSQVAAGRAIRVGPAPPGVAGGSASWILVEEGPTARSTSGGAR